MREQESVSLQEEGVAVLRFRAEYEGLSLQAVEPLENPRSYFARAL
jgi:hypothetical protein